MPCPVQARESIGYLLMNRIRACNLLFDAVWFVLEIDYSMWKFYRVSATACRSSVLENIHQATYYQLDELSAIIDQCFCVHSHKKMLCRYSIHSVSVRLEVFYLKCYANFSLSASTLMSEEWEWYISEGSSCFSAFSLSVCKQFHSFLQRPSWHTGCWYSYSLSFHWWWQKTFAPYGCPKWLAWNISVGFQVVPHLRSLLDCLWEIVKLPAYLIPTAAR